MSTEFKVNTLHTFGVVNVREANDGRKYIYLTDGIRETYRVEPFDFQIEWEKDNIPSTFECVVTSVNPINGLPFLKQRMYNILKKYYSRLNESYAFMVEAKETDTNTNAEYYRLKDYYGLYHRYYPAKNAKIRELGDVFSLNVTDIKEDNKYSSYLIFEEIEEEQQAVVNVQLPTQHQDETPEDIMKESRFGVENNVTEFKASIVYPAGTIKPDIDGQMKIILQTIAGFQNSQGGTLYIGVNDRGQVCGINNDFAYLNSSEVDEFSYKNTTDGYELKIRNSIKKHLGNLSNSSVDISFYKENDLIYCVAKISARPEPVFMGGYKLFQRAGNMTQLLKNDQITWFIKDRLNLGYQNVVPVSTPETSLPGNQLAEPQEVEISTTTTTHAVDNTHATIAKEDIWVYMTFYADGCWSYQDNEVKSDDVVWQIPILKKLKKEVLLMCYDNGCVNSICPYKIIKPIGQKNKEAGRRYKNGWNTDANIMAMMNIDQHDLVAFYSIDANSDEWVKVHRATDISVHTTLHLQGNVLVNERFNAKPIAYKHIPQDKINHVSSLVLNENQTSGYLGVRKNAPTFAKTMELVDELCGMK